MSDSESASDTMEVDPPKRVKTSQGPNLPKGVMPENIKTQKRLVVLENHAPTNVSILCYVVAKM